MWESSRGWIFVWVRYFCQSGGCVCLRRKNGIHSNTNDSLMSLMIIMRKSEHGEILSEGHFPPGVPTWCFSHVGHYEVYPLHTLVRHMSNDIEKCSQRSWLSVFCCSVTPSSGETPWHLYALANTLWNKQSCEAELGTNFISSCHSWLITGGSHCLARRSKVLRG